MPEEQNVQGDNWEKQLVLFIQKVLRWEKLGASNIDIIDPITGKKRGLDIVFAYKRKSYSPQEIVLVEAKTIDKMESLTKSKAEDWVTTLLEKLSNLPASRDFRDKYRPDTDAICQLGLIGLWVRDSDTYVQEAINKLLSETPVPTRRTPLTIGLISNHILINLYSIYREIQNLNNSDEYLNVKLFFPIHGNKPQPDGSNIPFEAMFSKFFFCRAQKKQYVIANRSSIPYEIAIAFFLGQINNFDELRFIGEALKHFQIPKEGGLEIYTFLNPIDLRSEIEHFQKDFTQQFVTGSIIFKQLSTVTQLPLLNDAI